MRHFLRRLASDPEALHGLFLSLSAGRRLLPGERRIAAMVAFRAVEVAAISTPAAVGRGAGARRRRSELAWEPRSARNLYRRAQPVCESASWAAREPGRALI